MTAVLVALLVLFSVPLSAQVTVPADAFVDSVGVNIHLHYDNTLYKDDFTLVLQRLQELGVRHYRDGLIDTTWQEYYDRHNALGQAGIKGTFVAPLNASSSVLMDYPLRVSSSFEAYEGPNEPNDSGDPLWDEKTRIVLRQLQDTQRVWPFPILGPSLTAEWAYTVLGDVGHYLDFGVIHDYFAGRHPGTTGWGANGYGSIDYNRELVDRIAPSVPVVSTETGYEHGKVQPDIVGRYMPRLLLEHFKNGIRKTYLYELADSDDPRQYGLLDALGTPRPAFTAVASLLHLLSDPGPMVLEPLDYSVSDSPDVHHLAFQKRDGTYLLAVWLEVSSWDVDSQSVIQVQPESVEVDMPAGYAIVGRIDWQPDGSTVQSVVSDTQLQISDSLTLFEIEPVFSAPEGLVIQ